ncbi:MAG: NCS2 family permease [Gemmatimonas sp.]|uniref:NCS2 family permease n=2 Tax=Gemmatimonas sp. TaxID=1962908 RepID=UPI0022CB4498|nr:NCS2 family permease [Gemmatimonas sp.]MCA2984283.1 NCS2 family permease [Gemmatimonas sp.]MCA2995032.1 NCS2 family permease [Gemmatimonas sp.]MCE2955024.1 NCS2 family permease [Gemmatimonas sp.]MCZ8011025.1 NCS2 family permease [Gemmatimonas sp.]MCZ8266154.1 NCS2 family permease [Gemmatimonas sp.]
MKRYFGFATHGTTWRTEIMAGVATFLTMAYIIVVNPAILEAAGLPREASITATILSAAFGTLIMGVYARRPFAIAPYMGENAFIVFTVVKGLGFPWQTALGAIFLAGVLFTLLTLLGVRRWLAAGIPANLKHSFTVGIGLFLTFIGLNAMGVVQLGVPGSPVALGALNRATTLVAIGGFFATAVLLARKHRSALLLGIIITSVLSFGAGITPLPAGVASAPPSLAPLFGQLDIAGALTLKALPVVVIVFVMAFVDTIGTLIGLGARAGLLDASGNLPDMEKPMLADAVVNMAAPVFGTTTCGAFVESAVGIEAGGRTGVTAIVVAVLFLASLFFAPLFTAIPAHATGVAIASMGVLMLGAMAALDFADYTEWVPAFLTIVLMAFTYNIGVGMTAGLLAYPVLKVGTGRATEVPAAMWWLAAMSLLFYAVYPYH